MNLVYRLEKTDCVLVKKEYKQVNFVCRVEKLGGIVGKLEHTLGSLLYRCERSAVGKDKNTLANVACAQEKMNLKGEKAEDALANLCCG